MRYKKGLNLAKNYSNNFSIPKRKKKFIKFIIIHYTGMSKEADAIKRLRNPKSKVSSHYLIKNNGQILMLVPDLYVAWHAGKSSWKSFKFMNKHSIGVEISNPGHTSQYKSFSKKQISSLKKLLKSLIVKYNIKLENLLGHSDIAPNRKMDPGEKFPWKELSKNHLCKWHNLDLNKIKKFRKKHVSKKDSNLFFKNLNRFGYNRIKSLNLQKSRKFLILAFQRRFRQELINGILDRECFIIAKNLMK